MGIEVVVSVFGIAIATVISVWTYRKMNPKRQLRYRVEVTPLLTTNTAAGRRLTVALDGVPVTDPRIVALTVWSTGRADISSQSFDAGAPLTFTLGAGIIDVIEGDAGPGPFLEVNAPDTVELRPALLHRKFQSTIRVIVDGIPNVSVNRVLANIDVLRDGRSDTASVIDTSRKRFRITPLLVWIGVLVAGLIVLIIGLSIYSYDKAAYLSWGVVGVLLMMLSLIAIVIVAIYRFIRWTARNVEARSGLR